MEWVLILWCFNQYQILHKNKAHLRIVFGVVVHLILCFHAVDERSYRTLYCVDIKFCRGTEHSYDCGVSKFWTQSARLKNTSLLVGWIIYNCVNIQKVGEG